MEENEIVADESTELLHTMSEELVPRAVVYHHYHRHRRDSRPFDEMTCGEASCHCFKFTCKFVFSSIGLCGIVVGYVLLGAFLFQNIEGRKERGLQQQQLSYKKDFLHNVTINAINLFKACSREMKRLEAEGGEEMTSPEPTAAGVDQLCGSLHTEVEGFLLRQLELYESLKYGTERPEGANETGAGAHGNHTPPLRWNMANSVLYATTVITTIGYGNLVPKTVLGQVATMLYAMVGVPLMLITLASMGNFMATCFRFLYARCCAPACSCLVTTCCFPNKPRRMRSEKAAGGRKAGDQVDTLVQADDDAGTQTTRIPLRPHRRRMPKEIPIYWCLLVITSYLICVAALFKFWEDWSWLQAIYFCFITFSTIGFGDIVPGRSLGAKGGGKEGGANELQDSYKVALCAVTVLFGLVIMSMCFNLMQDTVASYFRAWLQRIRGDNRDSFDSSSGRQDSYVSIREKPLSKSTLKGKRKRQPQEANQSPV